MIIYMIYRIIKAIRLTFQIGFRLMYYVLIAPLKLLILKRF